MKINDIEIDCSSGLVNSNGIVIAPLNVQQTRVALINAEIEFEEFLKEKDLLTIGANVFFMGKKFGINFDFRNGQLYSVWLPWYGGETGKKGYSSSENDLINDKNNLSKLLSRNFKKKPTVSDYSKNVFYFDWGYVSTSASLQSVIVTIGIGWNDKKLMNQL